MSTSSLSRIEDDIAASRERLVTTIDELVERAHPTNVMNRTKVDAQQRFLAATHDEQGQVKPELIAGLGGAAALFILWRIVRRARRH